MSKSNKQIGICGKCGKIHDIPDDKNWRFKCNECGTYRVFINQDVKINKGEPYGTRFRCGKCKSMLKDVGMGDGLGYGIDIFKCVNCKTEYIAMHY